MMALKPHKLRHDIPVHVALPVIVFLLLWLFSLGILEPCFVWLWTLPEHLRHAGPHGPTPCLLNTFMMFWAAGHLSAGHIPGQVYLPRALQAWEAANVPGHLFGDPFIHPPITLLLTRPFAALDYWPGFLLWSSFLSAATILLLWRAKLPWPVITAGMLSPVGLPAVMLGQLGLLAGALSLAALLRLEAAPIRAGILAGVAAIKPQDGLIVPFAMLARTRYRSILAGALAILIMCGLATLIFGPNIWLAYLHHGAKISGALLTESIPTDLLLTVPHPSTATHGVSSAYLFYSVSVFWMLRSLHLSVAVSLIGQIAAAIAAIAIVVGAWRKQAANPLARVALTVFLGLFLPPYALVQDLCGYSFMIAALAWQRRRLSIADAVLFTWPGYTPFVTGLIHISLTPLVFAWAASRAWTMMHEPPRPAPQ